jgi:hypothetical protein
MQTILVRKSDFTIGQRRPGGVTQVLQHLSTRHEALSSHPSTTKKHKNKIGQRT